MKLFIKLMLLVLVAALVGPFILKGPDGQPLMTLERLKVHNASPPATSVSAAPARATPSAAREPTALAPQDRTVYSWQDEQGQWHFSDRPPTQRSSERVELNPHVNTVQAMRMDEPVTSAAPQSQPSNEPPLPGVSLQDAAQLMERAKDVERLLQERKQQMDQLLDQH